MNKPKLCAKAESSCNKCSGIENGQRYPGFSLKGNGVVVEVIATVIGQNSKSINLYNSYFAPIAYNGSSNGYESRSKYRNAKDADGAAIADHHAWRQVIFLATAGSIGEDLVHIGRV